MSGPLAIAAVTAVLKDLLNNGIIAHDLASMIGTIKVSARAPDRVFASGSSSNEPNQLNLFLYHVAPNPAWRNVDLPSRDSRGDRRTNPPLALDLHYLLTAYGAEDFNAEVLLGYAMQLMHENPVLTRNAIREALKPTSPVTPSILPPQYAAALAEDLAEQFELMKITPQQMSTEEMSKLWAAFQAHYRPTAAYQVSVVLIENKRAAHAPLPVLTRGPLDPIWNRERGIEAQPNMLPPYPTLEQASPPAKQPVVRMGELLVLNGHHLTGVSANVSFRHLKTATEIQLGPTGPVTDREISVEIPPAPPIVPVPPNSPLNPDNWPIGQYAASAVIDVGLPDLRISNEVPAVIAPLLDPPFDVTVGGSGEITISVRVRPQVWRGQVSKLVVGTRELVAEPFTADKTPELFFKPAPGELPPGTHVLRLRVDGVESVLVDRSGAVPKFIAPLPTVVIP